MHIFLCDFLLDISQNSLEANSSLVEIWIVQTEKKISFRIKDNGKGMTDLEKKKVTDPFYTDGIKHKKRKIGLGIPFVIQASSDFSLKSEKGKGTDISFEFDLQDIDTPPLGDVAGTILSVFSHPSADEVIVERSIENAKKKDEYKIKRSELVQVLGGLDTSGQLSLAKVFLKSQEESLFS